MKGARATTQAIWLAFQGESPRSIAAAIAETYGYDLSRNVAAIRETYEYNETCQHTVPEALVCALEAADLEQAVRNAVSLGGDADTLAAIAGSLAEALHGIPPDFISYAETEILRGAPDIRDVLRAMYAQL